MRFTDLSGEVEVRIYTASGRLVVVLTNQSTLELEWDLRNGQGQLVGAGIYVWVATNNTGGRKIGQLAVIK